MLELTEKGDPAIYTELSQILAPIPFENLTLDQTPITNKLAWRAPKGVGFKITGNFCIHQDGSHPQFQYNMPLPSADIFIKSHAQIYPKYLEQAGGDVSKALQQLLNNEEEDPVLYPGIPPQSFVGRWLVIDENPGSGFAEDKNGRQEAPLPISIEGDLQAWYEKEAYYAHLEDLAPESDTVTACSFILPQNEVFWYQEIAKAAGGSKIELSELLEPEADFFVPSPSASMRLWLPEHMDDLYKESEGYQPSIYTSSTKRQPILDQTMAKSFNEKGEYFLYRRPGHGILSAIRRPGRVIRNEFFVC